MTRKLAIVLGLTALFTLVEIVGGLVSNSLTLLADAGHMGTDVAALGLALFGAKIAQRRNGAAQHFGNLRWEVLAALVNGLALFVIGLAITIEAVDRLKHPRPIDATLFGVVASVGLVVNVLSLRVLHGHHHHDINVRGAYLHIMGDILGSVGAISAAVVIHFTGWLPADPLISVLVSVLILRSAWRLVKESATILLDRVPGHVALAEVEARLRQHTAVDAVHDVHVWTVANGLVAMSAHVVVPALEEHPEVLRQLEVEMGTLGIGHVTIQLETGGACGGELCGDAEAPSGPASVGGHGAHHGHNHAH
ncbi:MAG: cation diffusion facilitator family transporter [Gemmatimonadota bacterium]